MEEDQGSKGSSGTDNSQAMQSGISKQIYLQF
jgi:hypothetical protein